MEGGWRVRWVWAVGEEETYFLATKKFPLPPHTPNSFKKFAYRSLRSGRGAGVLQPQEPQPSFASKALENNRPSPGSTG